MKYALSLLLIVASVSSPVVVFGKPRKADACQTPWEACKSSGEVKITNVNVAGCCAAPCDIKLGGTTEFSFDFIPGQDYPYLNQSACGMLGTACVPFPGFKDGAMCGCPGCKLEPACPFKSGTTYNISVPVEVGSEFPKDLSLFAIWKVEDSSKNVIACFEVPIKTV